jgi:SAM-dependent methyltransferase
VLSDLVALLALGLPLPEERAVEALGVRALSALEAARAVTREDESVVARLRIVPHGSLWIASDGWSPDHKEEDPLHVTGINPPARLLASLTVRRRVAAALDLGTGNGIQALIAANHADRVVASDVNPRALAYARFNAALNGVTNVEFREGNLFEPVAGERFDVIACNPPYVISPDSEFVYRDSGEGPGALCRRVVEALPAHLTEGGYATVLVSWPVLAGTDWSKAVGSWLAAGADAWLIRLGTDDPIAHAAEWNSPLIEIAPETYAPAVDRWLAYYEQQGIEGIDFGAVILRGTTGPARLIRADVARPGPDSASDQIERVFAASSGPYDHDLLDRRLSLPPGHVFGQQLVCEDGEWRLIDATLGVASGVDLRVGLDPVMVQVVLGLDGTRTGREAIERAAGFAGMDEAQLPGLVKSSASMIGELYRRGMLVEE